MSGNRIVLIFGFLMLLAAAVFPQDAEAGLPDGFSTIKLGMTMELVKDLLLSDTNFNYRGDPDVSLLARPDEALIQCNGFNFIHEAYFQFLENRLHTITLVLDIRRIDHYTMFAFFSGKYGEPVSLSPEKTYWEDGTVRVTLERPLSVKFMDIDTYNSRLTERRKEESLNQISLDMFLELF